MNIISAKRQTETLNEWISSLKEFQMDSFFDTKILGRAYEYIGMIQNVKINKKKISSTIHGSSEYKVIIFDNGSQIHGSCTCPLDKNCKHIAALILSQMDIKF